MCSALKRSDQQSVTMSAPTAVTENSPNANAISSLTFEEFHQVVLSTELDLSSFVSNIPALLQLNDVSVHNAVLTIDGKIRQALAVLGEGRRRIASFGDCNGVSVSSVAVEIALKLIESLAEQMMKWNDELMEQAVRNEENEGQIIVNQRKESPKEQDGPHGKANDNRKRHRKNQSSGTGNTKKRRSQESTQLCESLLEDSTDAVRRDQLNPAPPDRDNQSIRNLSYDKWQKRFQELVEFKRKHGHCNVPAKSAPLGSWVRTNRARYRGTPWQQHNPLTPGQIDQLDRLGFQWKARQGRPNIGRIP